MNKWEFIAKKCHFMSYKIIKEQLDSLVDGFNSVIPYDWVKVFTPEELEAAISGQRVIDLEDWMDNTEYKGYSSRSENIVNFWQVMKFYN